MTDTESERIQSIDSLAEKVEQHDGKLDQILGVLDRLTGGSATRPVTHERAQADEERHLDRSTSVAEQVRAELARAQAETTEKQEKESVAERLARLEEKAPLPPQPRRQRVMWGKR